MHAPIAVHRLSSARRGARRGSVLLPVVLVVFVLGALSVGLLSEGLAEQASVSQRQSNVVALQICERGLVQAMLEVLSQTDASDDGIGFTSGDYANGTYEVAAAQSATHPDRWTLTARAVSGHAVRRVEVGVRRRQSSDFVEGLYAKDTLTFNGVTRTDAYDSRNGTYAAQAINADAGGSYAEGGGHVGSNKSIMLNGSSVRIRGNAIPGPLHATEMSGNSTVLGDVLPRRFEIDLPAASLAEFQAALATNSNADLLPPNNGNGGNGNNGGGNNGGGNNGGGGNYDPDTYELTGKGQDAVSLKGGTYFFSNVRMTGQSTLTINGPTVIYVTGEFDVSGGGFVNTSGKPADLIVYAHPYALPPGHNPASSQVKLRGGAGAAMAVYAPGAELSIGGGSELFGSFIGNTITVQGNSDFHYDKALGDLTPHTKAILERLYWRDLDDERLR